MFRLLVTGSRDWSDVEVIATELQFVAKKYKNVVLVSGHAIGADRIAELIAVDLGWVVEIHEPDWTLHGKSAGFKRNTTMLETDVQAVLLMPSRRLKSARFLPAYWLRSHLNGWLIGQLPSKTITAVKG